jgi:hypothetical protein
VLDEKIEAFTVAGEEEAKRLRRHLQESIRRARSPEYQPKVRRLDDEHFLVITWGSYRYFDLQSIIN